METLVLNNYLNGEIFVDSAGTIGYHTGESADTRMIKQASARGYELTHKARKFNPDSDFKEFDYIVTMDDQNYIDIKKLDKKNILPFFILLPSPSIGCSIPCLLAFHYF